MTARKPPDRLLTVREVAKILDLAESTVRRLCAAGELPAIQPGGKGSAWKIPAGKLRAYLHERENDAARRLGNGDLVQ